MNFKTRKISEKTQERKTLEIKEKLKFFSDKISTKKTQDLTNKIPKIGVNIIALGLFIIIVFLTYGIYKTISNIDYTVLLKIAGSEIEKDAEGQTNFLILGIGGKNHDGGDLTDTIMIASLDHEKKHISMVSLPRDIYIKDSLIQTTRINEILHYAKKYFKDDTKGLEFFKSKIEEFTNTKIHYYLLLDFQGFKEIIDIVGGIEIDIKNDIFDPYYPKDGTYLFETFSIKKGLQTLDGETALKFARSRKTTSDFDRSLRQKQIIKATKDKALSNSTLLSPEKISEILNSLKNNITTNISPGEILTLASMAKDFNDENISSHPLHDDNRICGGILYTPPRIEFGGAFVLLPAGGTKYIHNYFNLILNHAEKMENTTKIHVLNATKKAGSAGETKQVLTRYCLDVNRFGNGRNQETLETTYYYKATKLILDPKTNTNTEIENRPEILDFLQEIIPGKETSVIPEEYLEYIENTDIILEMGEDYTLSEKYLEDPIHYLNLATPSPSATLESNVVTD